MPSVKMYARAATLGPKPTAPKRTMKPIQGTANARAAAPAAIYHHVIPMSPAAPAAALRSATAATQNPMPNRPSVRVHATPSARSFWQNVRNRWVAAITGAAAVTAPALAAIKAQAQQPLIRRLLSAETQETTRALLPFSSLVAFFAPALGVTSPIMPLVLAAGSLLAVVVGSVASMHVLSSWGRLCSGKATAILQAVQAQAHAAYGQAKTAFRANATLMRAATSIANILARTAAVVVALVDGVGQVLQALEAGVVGLVAAPGWLWRWASQAPRRLRLGLVALAAFAGRCLRELVAWARFAVVTCRSCFGNAWR